MINKIPTKDLDLLQIFWLFLRWRPSRHICIPGEKLVAILFVLVFWGQTAPTSTLTFILSGSTNLAHIAYKCRSLTLSETILVNAPRLGRILKYPFSSIYHDSWTEIDKTMFSLAFYECCIIWKMLMYPLEERSLRKFITE